MNHQHAYRRYTELDRCFNSRKKYWTKEELLEELRRRDFDISVRTLDQDIYNMRYETSLPFESAPIEYSRKERGYYYSRTFSISIPVDDEEIVALQIAVKTLNQLKGTQYFNRIEGAIDKVIRFAKQAATESSLNLKPIIVFEDVPYLKGYEFLDSVLNGIRNHQCLKLVYHPFGKHPFDLEIHPYFVKEFHNRWYLVGYNTYSNGLRTYALDRIQSIASSKSTFIPNQIVDPESYFADCIGVNFMDRTVETVKLSFSAEQGNYIKTQHLHQSQEVVLESEDTLIVELKIIINYEFKMLILSFGDKVKVLEPLSLANEIANVARNILNAYGELDRNLLPLQKKNKAFPFRALIFGFSFGTSTLIN